MECLRYMSKDTFDKSFSLIWSRYFHSKDKEYSYYSIYCDDYIPFIQKLVNEDYRTFCKVVDYYRYLLKSNKIELLDNSHIVDHAYLIYTDDDIKHLLSLVMIDKDYRQLYFNIREKLDY